MVTTDSPSLSIFYEDQKVGELSYHLGTETFHLRYSAEWMKTGFALSPHLPLVGEILPENTRKFLENLLPEEEALKTLARALKIAPSNIFALISAIGREATGAFTFASGGEKVETSFRPISLKELTVRVRERATQPIGLWDGKPRLSLAGVQEKLAVTLKNGEYGFGEGKLASTHILKFSKKDQHLVLNEFFCMKLAEKIGLGVARVEMLSLGERVLQVERFDRAWKGETHVVRKHVIDGCQALNAPPGFKYQRIVPVGKHRDDYLGPVNVVNLSSFNQQCRVPAKAQLQLLHWILFNLVIGNTDNHGKNISYYVSKNGYEIAPSYDLVNVTVYKDFHQELAFQIGDTFVLDEVMAFQLAEMGQQMNLSPRFVGSHLKKLATSILKALDEVGVDDLTPDEREFMNELQRNIKSRAQKFVKQVGLIGSVAKNLK
ncbi:MAG: HipA domain-containing protein [Bdellovibrionales bacterium]